MKHKIIYQEKYKDGALYTESPDLLPKAFWPIKEGEKIQRLEVLSCTKAEIKGERAEYVDIRIFIEPRKS